MFNYNYQFSFKTPSFLGLVLIQHGAIAMDSVVLSSHDGTYTVSFCTTESFKRDHDGHLIVGDIFIDDYNKDACVVYSK